MNYNRRSTRPDSLFYRDQRKLRGTSRARGGGPIGGKPLAIGIAILAAVGLVIYLLLFRH